MTSEHRQRSILLIDDNPHDYEAFKRSCRKAGMDIPIMYCADGDEALDFLLKRKRNAAQANWPIPGLIVLDLNLPGTDGREVLHILKSHEHLKAIPVIILTTSSNTLDIEWC